ncbi:hypothetical protein JB92DRAFT_3123862 [Gautieria morchelliformis]|nr:hypothetical protein JB92DRAFT_3123862 [Gautieria morchelliformis]
MAATIPGTPPTLACDVDHPLQTTTPTAGPEFSTPASTYSDTSSSCSRPQSASRPQLPAVALSPPLHVQGYLKFPLAAYIILSKPQLLPVSLTPPLPPAHPATPPTLARSIDHVCAPCGLESSTATITSSDTSNSRSQH